jgi:hypothetical protein
VQGAGVPMDWQGGFSIYSDAGDDKAPAVAAIPTLPHHGQYLVVWQSSWSAGNDDIYGRRLKGDGSQEGSILWIGRIGGTASYPVVAANEGAREYLVAWNQVIQPPNLYSGARARSVNLDGEFTSEEAWLWWFNSNHPAVTSGPLGDFLVTFESSGLDWGIYGRLWGNRVYLPVAGRRFQ